jgi:hypothetical protein
MTVHSAAKGWRNDLASRGDDLFTRTLAVAPPEHGGWHDMRKVISLAVHGLSLPIRPWAVTLGLGIPLPPVPCARQPQLQRAAEERQIR